MEFLSSFSKIFLKRLKKLLNIFAHFGNNFLNQKIYSWNLSAIILILFTSWALAKPPRSGVKYETASILHINAIKAPVASDESIWNSDNLNSFRWHKKKISAWTSSRKSKKHSLHRFVECKHEDLRALYEWWIWSWLLSQTMRSLRLFKFESNIKIFKNVICKVENGNSFRFSTSSFNVTAKGGEGSKTC